MRMAGGGAGTQVCGSWAYFSPQTFVRPPTVRSSMVYAYLMQRTVCSSRRCPSGPGAGMRQPLSGGESTMVPVREAGGQPALDKECRSLGANTVCGAILLSCGGIAQSVLSVRPDSRI